MTMTLHEQVLMGGAAVGGEVRREPVSLEPISAYEAVTRQMVVGLSEELREIKARLNGLLFMVAGSMLLEVVNRLVGPGSR
jgi:hypothetical protein